MATRSNSAYKVWAMPVILGIITLIGLILAILGTGVWHVLSWIALFYPVYVMGKYGMKYFG